MEWTFYPPTYFNNLTEPSFLHWIFYWNWQRNGKSEYINGCKNDSSYLYYPNASFFSSHPRSTSTRNNDHTKMPKFHSQDSSSKIYTDSSGDNLPHRIQPHHSEVNRDWTKFKSEWEWDSIDADSPPNWSSLRLHRTRSYRNWYVPIKFISTDISSPWSTMGIRSTSDLSLFYRTAVLTNLL